MARGLVTAMCLAAVLALPAGMARGSAGSDISRGGDAAPAADVLAQKGDAPDPAAIPQSAEDAWEVQCIERGDGDTARSMCRAFQNMVVPDTRERLLTLLVEPQPGETPFRLALALPHGLFLPAGVEIRIDEAEPIRIVISTSDAEGAYAAIAADAPLVEAMKSGTTLYVSFRSAGQRSFTVPVSLAGFAAAMQEIE